MTTEITAMRKSQLRQKLRQLRRGMSSRQQAAASRALRDRLLRNSRYQQARHIACYLPVDGEIDTRPLIRASLAAGKKLYLPVVEGTSLQFHLYARGTPLYLNRFGLLQPLAGKQPISAAALDLVVIPLVGFDRGGARLGRGGGFYDRAFKHLPKREPRPFLLGVAHAVQELDCVPVERWDRRLHGIATDRDYFIVGSGASVYRFRDNARLQG